MTKSKIIFALTLILNACLCAEESISEAKPLWSVDLQGLGRAALSANDDAVIVSDENAFRCFRASDGKRMWTHPLFLLPSAPMNYAQPLIVGTNVLLLHSSGDFNGVRLKNGKHFLDAYNIAEKFDARAPLLGYASAPLIYDNKFILNPGAQDASIIALNPETGDLLWKTPGRRASRSDFVAGEFGGVKQLVGFDHDSLGGWAVDSGKRLWQLDTPDRIEDEREKLYATKGQLLSSTSDGLTTLFRFKSEGAIDEKPLVRSADAKGRILALSGRLAVGIGDGVFALNLDNDLRESWRLEEREVPNAICLLVEGARLFVFSSHGTLAIFSIAAAKPVRIAVFKLADSLAARPAIANGRLFVRADKRLLCFEIKLLLPD